MQCGNYSKGLITGSLCSPLCDTHDIKFEKCLGHAWEQASCLESKVERKAYRPEDFQTHRDSLLGNAFISILQTVKS